MTVTSATAAVSDRDSGVKLPELVAAFSLATDLGLGQPMEHVLRSWRIAARLGEHVGVEVADRGALYYVTTLAWVGCVADTPEVAAVFGDDITFRRDYYQVDLAGLPMLGFMLRHVGAGSPPLRRLRLAANLVASGGKKIERGLMSHCLTTSRMAERLGLDERVCRPLHQVFARWDGKGIPGDVRGEDIALSMRLFNLSENSMTGEAPSTVTVSDIAPTSRRKSTRATAFAFSGASRLTALKPCSSAVTRYVQTGSSAIR